MIQEVETLQDLETQDDNIVRLTYAINACIRKINVLCEIMDRKYATNKHQEVLREEIDPNT